MVLISGGSFLMGSDRHYSEERPMHRRTVASYLIDSHAVTNEQFSRFVADTGYITVAERPLPEATYSHLSAEEREAGALVFTPTSGPVRLDDWRQWWRWVSGAQWRFPKGPGSTFEECTQHPVVQIAYQDAAAYASWAGKRLPTEAEHEYAARGGRSGQDFAWGDEPYPGGATQANTWCGSFPYDNKGRFGPGTAPVGEYPANDFGLYDMIGNVWEWTSDFYIDHHVDPALSPVQADGRPNLFSSAIVANALGRRVLKGGSYLCSPEYCLRFRPAARSPQSEDSATTHIGFRCVSDVPPTNDL